MPKLREVGSFLRRAVHPIPAATDVPNYLAILAWLGVPQLVPFDGQEAGVTRWLVFAGCAAVLFLIAGVRQEGELKRLTTVTAPSPIEQVASLVAEARLLWKDTEAGTVPPGVQEPRTKAFRDKSTTVLQEVSPEHTLLFTTWKTRGYFVPQDDEPRYEHLAQVARAENMYRGLEEIERRLRARAGEDIGKLSFKRARFGDFLWGAYHELQRLQRVEAPIEEFRAWDAELSRLVHLALPDEAAHDVMDRSAYKPGRVRSGGLDDEAMAIVTITGSKCLRQQTRLDDVTFRDSFDPRDWHGRWT